MDNYERKMKKIEDILTDATQTELNHIHEFFPEAAKMEHDKHNMLYDCRVLLRLEMECRLNRQQKL